MNEKNPGFPAENLDRAWRKNWPGETKKTGVADKHFKELYFLNCLIDYTLFL